MFTRGCDPVIWALDGASAICLVQGRGTTSRITQCSIFVDGANRVSRVGFAGLGCFMDYVLDLFNFLGWCFR